MPRARKRDGGFVLVVVFLVIVLLAGLAGGLLRETQSDLQVAGMEREASVSFNAADAAIAHAKDWLAARVLAGRTPTQILQAADPADANALCQPDPADPGVRPGVLPRPPQPLVVFDAAREGLYRFCIRNNARDPRYGDPVPSGDTSDGDGVLAIEGYGFGPNGAVSRVTVEVAVSGGALRNGEYGQAGGGAAKQAVGETLGAVTTSQVSY